MRYLIQLEGGGIEAYTFDEKLDLREDVENQFRKILQGDSTFGLSNCQPYVESFPEELIAKGLWFFAPDLSDDPEGDAWCQMIVEWVNGESDPILALPFRVQYRTLGTLTGNTP